MDIDRNEKNRQNQGMNSEPSDILETLCDRMKPAQQLCFKQAMVRQTIHYVAQRLPAEADDCGERGFIEIAQDWLDSPTAENAKRASTAAIFDCVDGGVRYFDYGDYFLEPAWAAGAIDGVTAARSGLVAAIDREAIVRQWQVATAEAILQGQPLPELDDL
jgi:hypothetical protein